MNGGAFGISNDRATGLFLKREIRFGFGHLLARFHRRRSGTAGIRLESMFYFLDLKAASYHDGVKRKVALADRTM